MESNRAALYARVSSAEQAEKQTIETQLIAIRLFCEREGFVITKEYLDDGVSGTIPMADRPGGSKMLVDAATGLFSWIIVHRLDRFGRAMADYTATVRDFTRMGVHLRSVTEQVDDTYNGRFIGNIHGSMAEWEAGRIRDRTHSGKLRAVSKGKWPGGLPPYGYRVDSGGTLQLEPEEAKVVGDIFRLYTDENKSMYEIADYLAALNAPLKVDFKDNYKRKRGSWKAAKVSNILANPIYTGHGTLTLKIEGVPTEKRFVAPAIIDEATFQHCRELATRHAQLPTRKATRLYLLRGLAKCGICGSTYVGARTQNGKYSYYQCRKNRLREPGLQKCPGKSVPAEWLESEVWRQVEALLRNPGDIIHDLQARLKASIDSDGVAKEIAAIDRALAENQSGRGIVINLTRRKTITEEEAAVELAKIKSEETLLNKRRSELQSVQQHREKLQREMLSTSNLLAELGTRIDNATPETKCELLKRLVSGIQIDTLNVRGETTVVVTVNFKFSEQLGAESTMTVYGVGQSPIGTLTSS